MLLPHCLSDHSRRHWQSKGQRRRAFIAALHQTGSVIHAAAIVDVDRKLQALELRQARSERFDFSTGHNSAGGKKMFDINGPALRPPERQ